MAHARPHRAREHQGRGSDEGQGVHWHPRCYQPGTASRELCTRGSLPRVRPIQYTYSRNAGRAVALETTCCFGGSVAPEATKQGLSARLEIQIQT
ncbi:Hypothetical protein AA314_05761 [Archangium gephyra]|uniref:Uncharacterized protein n=1 Tax=Archangium gephyra TaxID=48 RepID=A0AAC8QAH2_9BACT|nr:Hypothetical protein AA314_05761 [Archangium gephyra]